MKKENVAVKMLSHPDLEEVLAKLAIGISNEDIAEYLAAKYSEINERHLILSAKVIKLFRDNYFDFYNKIREDAANLQSSQLSATQRMDMELSGNITYQNALNRYVNEEIDIKLIAKKLVAAIEVRASQVFDELQSDVSNFKNDEIMILYMNSLANICEKFDNIQTGNIVNQQTVNNINIQIVDQHISQIYEIIKKVLSNFDNETSMRFIDILNAELNALKPSDDNKSNNNSIDTRLSQIKSIETSVNSKLNN